MPRRRPLVVVVSLALTAPLLLLPLAQGLRGVPGQAETRDLFGARVSLVDHDRDGHPDLTVGAPGENDDVGAITIIDGSRRGFTTRGSRTIGLGSLGYPTPAAARFSTLLGH